MGGRGLAPFRGDDGVVLARGGWLADGEADVLEWPALDALTAASTR